MPLVFGVCRTASAPMLSHGGSRLNASKPEANPKTSFPHHIRSFVEKNGTRDVASFLRYWRDAANALYLVFSLILGAVSARRSSTPNFRHIHTGLFCGSRGWGNDSIFLVPSFRYGASLLTNRRKRFSSSQREKNPKLNRLSNESCHRRPRWREVHEKFTRFFFFLKRVEDPVGNRSTHPSV